MYSAYSEDLERNRIVKTAQRILLSGIVFTATLAVIGVIGFVVGGNLVGDANILLAELPKPPQ